MINQSDLPYVAPIFWISGPPASGKTTLCQALLSRFERGFHLEVDRLRSMVGPGLADSVPWSDETERQFQIAEATACDIAKRYQSEGFAVAIDHCRNLPTLERVMAINLLDRPVIKVCLMPDLEVNLQRNALRTNKSFQPELLVETISYTNAHYRTEIPGGWLLIDNTDLTVEQTIELTLGHKPMVYQPSGPPLLKLNFWARDV